MSKEYYYDGQWRIKKPESVSELAGFLFGGSKQREIGNNKPFDPELISIDPSEGELPVDGLLQEMGSTGKQEDQRTFSLQDMIECYERAYSDAGYEDQGLEWSKTEYFREKGIDIAQQV